MKKAILPVLAICMLIAVPVFGQTYTTQTIPGGTDIDIWALLTKTLNWFFNIVLFIAAIFIVYSGWQYITAAGDTTRTGKALTSLIYALVGIGIALLAKGLIYMVGTFLGKKVTF